MSDPIQIAVSTQPVTIKVVAGGAVATEATAARDAALAAQAAVEAVAAGLQGEVKSSGFTAVVGHTYLLDSSAGAFNVTAPASLSDGDEFRLEDHAGATATHAVTVLRNGHTIDGLAEDFVIQDAFVAIRFRFNGSTLIPRLG